MGQILDPTLVALVNSRQYATLQTPRRNAGNTAYEWGTAAWLDTANVFAATQTFSLLTIAPNGYQSGASGAANGVYGSSIRIGINGQLSWSSVTSPVGSGNADTYLRRNAAGVVQTGSSASVFHGFICGSPTTTTVGLIVKTITSQSVNAFEVHNTSNVALTSITAAGNLLVPDGAAATPSIGFIGATNYGFFKTGNTIVITLAGTARWSTSTTHILGTSVGDCAVRHTNSTSAAPAYSFNGDADTGMFRVGADIVGFSTAALERFQVNAAGSLIANSAGANAVGIVPLISKGSVSQTANLQEWQTSVGVSLAAIDKSGGIVPASMADGSAANGTLYYSTTAGKLVFKDSGGVVNNLY